MGYQSVSKPYWKRFYLILVGLPAIARVGLTAPALVGLLVMALVGLLASGLVGLLFMADLRAGSTITSADITYSQPHK